MANISVSDAETRVNNGLPVYTVIHHGKYKNKVAEITKITADPSMAYTGQRNIVCRVIEDKKTVRIAVHQWNYNFHDYPPVTQDTAEDFFGKSLSIGDAVYIGRGGLQIVGTIREIRDGEVKVYYSHITSNTGAPQGDEKFWEASLCIKIPTEDAMLKTLVS